MSIFRGSVFGDYSSGIFGQKSVLGVGLGATILNTSSKIHPGMSHKVICAAQRAGASGLGGCGLGQPYPDVYPCNTNSQCQSGWCNTAIPVRDADGNVKANGQCQTRGKVNPSIGGGGQAGAYCSMDEQCGFNLSCNKTTNMCESAQDPGNACYIAGHVGQQDGLAGFPKQNANAIALEVMKQVGILPSPELSAKIAQCYVDGYNKGIADQKYDTRPCSHIGQIQRVQQQIGTTATGKWTAADQAALQKTGKTFKFFAPGCTGNPPTVTGTTGTKTDKPPTPPTPPVKPPAKPPVDEGFLGLPWWAWAGVVAVAGGLGVAVYYKKKKGKAPMGATRTLPGSPAMGAMRPALANQKLSSGYAFSYGGKRWRQSPDEDWDTVMLGGTRGLGGTFVGTRYIDGTRCNVFHVRGTTEYYAQSVHQSR